MQRILLSLLAVRSYKTFMPPLHLLPLFYRRLLFQSRVHRQQDLRLYRAETPKPLAAQAEYFFKRRQQRKFLDTSLSFSHSNIPNRTNLSHRLSPRR